MDTANKNINIKTNLKGKYICHGVGSRRVCKQALGLSKWGVKFVNIISRAFQFSKKYL